MKKQNRLLAWILSVILLFSLTACGRSAADPVVRELLGSGTRALTPADYEDLLAFYRAVEQRRSDENNAIHANALYNEAEDGEGLDRTLTLSVDWSVLDREQLAAAAESIGLDLSWIKNLSLDSSLSRSEQGSGLNTSLSLNGSDIVDANLVLDEDGRLLYVSVPQLSDSAAKSGSIALEDLIPAKAFPFTLLPDWAFPPQEDVLPLIGLLFELVSGEVQTVSIEDASITADGVSCDCTVISLHLEGEELLRLASSSLDAAEKDSLLEKLLAASGLFGGDEESIEAFHARYAELLQSARGRLDELGAEGFPYALTVSIYVDAKGEILGREALLAQDGEPLLSLSVLSARDGDRLGMEASLRSFGSYSYSEQDFSNDYSYETALTLTGGGSFTKDGKLSGSFRAGLGTRSRHNEEESTSALDLGTVEANCSVGKEGFLGEILLEPGEDLADWICEKQGWQSNEAMSRLLRSMSLSAVFSSGEGSDLALILRCGGQEFLTLRCSSAPGEGAAAEAPADTADALDFTSWLQSIGPVSLDTVVNKLLRAGMPAEWLASYTG